MTMYTLFYNSGICTKCGSCERLIHGFKSKHNGVVLISKYNYHNNDEVRYSSQALIDVCPNKAIRIE